MRVQLTKEQATLLRPLVEWCAETQNRNVVIGQVITGDWRELDKTWLICATIPTTAARKIRKVIERERIKSEPAPAAATALS